MNAEQLNAIKERAAKATPGPWEIDRNSDDDVFVTDIWFDGEDGGHAEIHGDTVASSIHNAEFIASCREDVPALVAEVERLQELLKHSLETQVKYTIALLKISCDSQYLNVATSSKGGEKLIEIARDALK